MVRGSVDDHKDERWETESRSKMRHYYPWRHFGLLGLGISDEAKENDGVKERTGKHQVLSKWLYGGSKRK